MGDINRLNLIEGSRSPNFIGAWQIIPEAICNDLISFFEENPALQAGGLVGAGLINDDKRSTDISINPKDLFDPRYRAVDIYIKELYKCYRDYAEQWSFLDQFPRLEIGAFNIQKYIRGGHFKKIHSERSTLETAHRVFAWMTYLNDVQDGGETSFTHFDLHIKPEQGKTLIWPAEWTHAHFGGTVNAGEKYIITGWMHFSA